MCGKMWSVESEMLSLELSKGLRESMQKQTLTVEAFLEYIKSSKSKSTYKEYKEGLTKFSEWYGKTLNEILEERRQDVMSGNFTQNMRFSRELEKFHKWLITPQQDRGAFSINSARNYCLGIRQLFRFYGFPLTNLSSEIGQTVQTTKDFIPTIQQYRDMFNVADIRGKLIISMGLDLAWRIGDFVSIRKDMIPDLEQETPIPFDLVTQKEKVIAKSFLGVETVELLKTYLSTIKDNPNPYLFPANHDKRLDDETINYSLRQLAERAKVKIPKDKRLRFHCFRKRFLTTCADLRIDVNIAKILCGKDVESSMLAYLSEVDHKKAFQEIDEALNLSNGRIKESMLSKDAEIQALKKELEEQKSLVKAMVSLFGKEILKKAVAQLEQQSFREIFVFGDRENVHYTNDKTQIKIKRDSPIDYLDALAKLKEDKDREEYQKLIESNNGNGDQK
jgi:integrase